MGKRSPFPTAVSEILEKIFGKSHHNKKYREAQLIHVWKKVVGEKLALHTYPEKIENECLICLVDNSAWLHEIQFMKKDIISKINDVMQKRMVRNIYFRLGKIPAPDNLTTGNFGPT